MTITPNAPALLRLTCCTAQPRRSVIDRPNPLSPPYTGPLHCPVLSSQPSVLRTSWPLRLRAASPIRWASQSPRLKARILNGESGRHDRSRVVNGAVTTRRQVPRHLRSLGMSPGGTSSPGTARGSSGPLNRMPSVVPAGVPALKRHTGVESSEFARRPSRASRRRTDSASTFRAGGVAFDRAASWVLRYERALTFSLGGLIAFLLPDLHILAEQFAFPGIAVLLEDIRTYIDADVAVGFAKA